MIGRVRGQVAALGEEAALIDVGGVGYLVHAGGRTLARLSVGEAATLHVETHVREDAIRLYGFLSETERAWFAHLQTAPGVGARVALAILDALAPSDLSEAIALQDKAALARANGVGPKLAARIAQELSGKPPPRGLLSTGPVTGEPAAQSPAPAATSAAASAPRGEALSALLNLGIDRDSAVQAVNAAVKALGGQAAAADLIRAALKEIAR